MHERKYEHSSERITELLASPASINIMVSRWVSCLGEWSLLWSGVQLIFHSINPAVCELKKLKSQHHFSPECFLLPVTNAILFHQPHYPHSVIVYWYRLLNIYCTEAFIFFKTKTYFLQFLQLLVQNNVMNVYKIQSNGTNVTHAKCIWTNDYKRFIIHSFLVTLI